MKRLNIIILCMAAALSLMGQTTGDSLSQDTVYTEVKRTNGILDVFEGNPGKAVVKGLLFPAGGQIYNKRWWKVPLALAAEGAAIGYLIYNYDRYNRLDQDYTNVAIFGNESEFGLELDVLLDRRNAARQDRELAWVFFAGAHLIVAFEAYIDRHLIEFDVSDDLSFTPVQSFLGPIPSLTYTIPLTTNKYKSADSLLLP